MTNQVALQSFENYETLKNILAYLSQNTNYWEVVLLSSCHKLMNWGL